MDALDHAIRIACAWTADQQSRRSAVADALAAIVVAYTEAIEVWQGLAETQVAPAQPTSSMAEWLGPRRTAHLRGLASRVNENLRFVERETGVPAQWNFAPDDAGFGVAEQALLRERQGEVAARYAADELAARIVRLQAGLRDLGLA